jgi:iron complex outermembrane receptor protein
MKSIVYLLVVLVGLVSKASGQEVRIDTIEISVSASPLPKAGQNVLSALDFRQNDGLQYQEILHRSPGIWMQTGALNTNRISLRGIGNRSPFATSRLRAYFGEIPLTTGIGETTLEDIPTQVLQNINIWKGPAPLPLGSGLGGAMQLDPWGDTRFSSSDLSVEWGTGSFGQQQLHTTAFLHLPNSGTDLRLDYNRLHQDGYRENNQYDRSNFFASGRIRSGDRQEWQFLVHQVDLCAEIPSSLNRTDFENTPQIAAPNWAAVEGFEEYQKGLGGLSYQYTFNANWKAKAALFGSYRNSYESRPFNILTENSIATGARLGLEWNRSGQTWRGLKWGGEFFREQLSWQTYETFSGNLGPINSDNEEVRQLWYSFISTEFQFSKRLNLLAGLNVSQVAYDLEDRFVSDSLDLSSTYDFDPAILPRLQLNWQALDGPQQLRLYALWSRGYAAPTLEETLTPDGTFNPDIQPELGWNAEVGGQGRFFQGSGKGLLLDVNGSVFFMPVSNLLVARRTAEDQFIGLNAGQTHHLGAELQLELMKRWDQLSSSPVLQSGLAYTCSRFRFAEFIDDADDFSGNALTGAPPHQLRWWMRGSLDLRPQWRLFASLSYQFVSQVPITDANSVYSDPYDLVHLKMGSQFQVSDQWMFSIEGGINNLLNEQYASMVLINASSFGNAAPRYYYPGLPRHYYLRIKLNYNVDK